MDEYKFDDDCNLHNGIYIQNSEDLKQFSPKKKRFMKICRMLHETSTPSMLPDLLKSTKKLIKEDWLYWFPIFSQYNL